MNELDPHLRASALLMRVVGWGIIVAGPIAALAYAPGFFWGQLPARIPSLRPATSSFAVAGARPYLFMLFSLYSRGQSC